MDKRGKIYIGLTVLVTLLIIIMEYNKPKDVNWFPSYTHHHKIPFGTYVFHDQLERIFSKENVIDVQLPPFEFLKQNKAEGTYIFINDNVRIDNTELESLLEWTAKGNKLAIASTSFGETLLDTLNLKQSVISNFNNLANVYELQLKNERLKKEESYTFDKANFVYHFSERDSLKTSVISVINNASENPLILEDNYLITIKQPFGEGEIILSTFPQAYTNYFILEEPNQNYTAGLLSYLDTTKPIYYDNHYKSGKTFNSSPLYVFLKAKELRWAYYLMLIGALLFIIFEGKRKQRAIPIVTPLRNQTVDFTRTIANMYYEEGKHLDIAQHKIQHFLEYIRTHLHLNTSEIDTEFLNHLSARSNNTIEDTASLFKTIEAITNSTTINAEALHNLNASIETYKSNNKWKIKK